MNKLSLKARLALVAAIALLLGLVPSALLLIQANTDLARARAEVQGIPVNAAWQKVLTVQREHRQLAAEALSTRPAAREELVAVQARWHQALDAVTAALPADADARHQAAIQALGKDFDDLGSALAASQIDMPKLQARHQLLSAAVTRAEADFNGDVGLTMDPQPSSHFAIVAGLQAAPQVGDALGELGAIARGVAVDDIAGVNAALTRYREHSDEMLLAMHQAQRSGGAVAQALGPLIDQAQQQRQLVDDNLQAAAKDVNYPLEQLAKSFATAARLQDEISTRALATLDTELHQRASAAAIKRNALLIIVPLMLALLGFVMLRAVRQLLGPVALMVEITERIAGGDLSQPVPQGRRDELGRVLLALDHMQTRLRALIEQIHEGAGSIRTAAHEIAAGNHDLAQRTEQAAARLQQTAANVDLLDASATQSTEAAGQANTLSVGASDVAATGGAVVEKVVATMSEIHNASSRIADITGMIDSIAFQTNILALNAAVEAARAGEQGRGFAVVASEVRALAGRSGEAAREIRVLIQQSVERVEVGSGLAAQAGEVMQQIVGRVAEVSDTVRQLAAQAGVQAGQTHELGQAIRTIDTMTQQNAALVEQSAASAEALRGSASAMDLAVQVFRL